MLRIYLTQKKKERISLRKNWEKSADDKGDCIVDYIFTLGEEYDKHAPLGCKKCLTLFYWGMEFVVPMKYDTIRWSLIWKTPRSLWQWDDLKDIVGAHVTPMNQTHYHALCSWSLHYVEVCMILILDAFHCPGVQCYLSQDRETWSVKDKAEWEEIDQKQQDFPNVGEIAENQPIEPIIWGGGRYQSVKKLAFPQLYIHCWSFARTGIIMLLWR